MIKFGVWSIAAQGAVIPIEAALPGLSFDNYVLDHEKNILFRAN